MGDSLKGKVAIVTGSGQGIGRAIAMLLAKEGAKVVTNNRRKGSTGQAVIKERQEGILDEGQKNWLKDREAEARGDAETTAQAINDAGGEAIPFFGDISGFDVAAEIVRTAVKQFGKIDILANIAGTFGFVPVWEMEEETWDITNRTKPKGYFNAIRHALPSMMEQKWGRIINCTSRAFLGDVLKHAHYCAANAGVVGLTRAVAIEVYPYGITCNAISPFAKTRAAYGLSVLGDATKGSDSPWMDTKFAFPLEKAPTPETIAPFVCYLASDDAAKISGSVFNLGGNNIGLYSEPAIIRNLTKPGDPWTIEELKQQVDRALFMGYKSIADLD